MSENEKFPVVTVTVVVVLVANFSIGSVFHDRNAGLGERQAKIDAAVNDVISKEKCSIPEGKMSRVCAVRDISSTEHGEFRLEAERIAVIATQNITKGFNLEGQPAQEICVSFGYVSNIADDGFVDPELARTVSTKCDVVALEQ